MGFRVPHRDLPWSQFGSSLPHVTVLFGLFTGRMNSFAAFVMQAYYEQLGLFVFNYTVFGPLAGLAELARFVLLVLYLRAVARAVRAHDHAGGFMALAIALPVVLGVFLVVNLVIYAAAKPGAPALMHSTFAVQVLLHLVLMGIFGWAAVMLNSLRPAVRARP
jgi:hypothetical protein